MNEMLPLFKVLLESRHSSFELADEVIGFNLHQINTLTLHQHRISILPVKTSQIFSNDFTTAYFHDLLFLNDFISCVFIYFFDVFDDVAGAGADEVQVLRLFVFFYEDFVFAEGLK